MNLRDNPNVTDAGLAHLKECSRLEVVWLGGIGPAVTDVGAGHLKNCTELRQLDLSDTAVTDAGLAHFRGRPRLTHLWLRGVNGLTDAGLAPFKECRNLSVLNLSETRVTDAGLANFAGCTKLTVVWLRTTRATDAGLANFTGCADLTELNVLLTGVTAKGVAAFAKALPQCAILWDNGLVPPTAVGRRDRAAAEWVLAAGGTVRVNGANPLGKPIAAVADLPREDFQLTDVGLRERKGFGDDELAAFRHCPDLQHIDFHACRQVTDVGLENFKGAAGLLILSVGGTQITDAGLGLFGRCAELHSVYAADTALTDAGLAHLKGCSKLTFLGVPGTKVTVAGVRQFAADHPNCKIVWDGGEIAPARK